MESFDLFFGFGNSNLDSVTPSLWFLNGDSKHLLRKIMQIKHFHNIIEHSELYLRSDLTYYEIAAVFVFFFDQNLFVS